LSTATTFPDLFAALAAPFDIQEVRVRSQSGRQLHYITARTAMNRLDDILGPENWWDDYTPGENSVVCRLTLRLPDGSTITKADAGGYAGMPDSGDDDKSGFSDAFKRACSKFGVARYLYRDGVPAFVRDREPSIEAGTPVAQTARNVPPAPEDRASTPPPGGTRPSPARAVPPPSDVNGHANGNGNGNGHGHRNQEPRTGRALFAWTKEMEQRHEVGLLKYLNSWAKLQEFPPRMVDWDVKQVKLAHAEATRKLQAISGGRSEAYEEAME
jgi:hypothetical protein